MAGTGAGYLRPVPALFPRCSERPCEVASGPDARSDGRTIARGRPGKLFAMLVNGSGEDAVLGLDDLTTEVDNDALRSALDGPRTEARSPVILPMDASFESLHLWLVVPLTPRPARCPRCAEEHAAAGVGWPTGFGGPVC